MASKLHDVTHAFTLKHRWLSAAILHGQKPVENRSQCWKPGWYAVHTGLAKETPGDEMEMHVRKNCDGDESVSMIAEDVRGGLIPKGHIVGMCKLAHALPVDAASLKDCGWAMGPICLVISETVWLKTPLEATGQLGTWPLSSVQKCRIVHQIGQCAIGVRGHELTYPADPVALLRMMERHRAAKRARREADESQPKLKLVKVAR